MFKGIVTYDVSVNGDADCPGEGRYMKGPQLPSPVISGYFCPVTAEVHGGGDDRPVLAQTVEDYEIIVFIPVQLDDILPVFNYFIQF